MDLREVVDPEYGIQQDEWSSGRPTFGENGQIKVVGWSGRRGSHKWYITKCSKCADDGELFGEGFFRTDKSKLIKGSVPCGCSKVPNWTETQMLIRVKRKAKCGNYRIVGWIGDYIGVRTRVALECPEHGTFDHTINNLFRNSGCPKCKNNRISEALMDSEAKVVEEISDLMASTGHQFIGFAEPYKGHKTKVLSACSRHGIWDTGTVGGIRKGSRCPSCGYSESRASRLIPDDEHVKEFMATGSFEDGTTFWRSDRLDSDGWKGFWFYFCPKCETVSEAHRVNIKSGQRSCSCYNTRQTKAYINEVTNLGEVLAYKYGVACTPRNRTRSQNAQSVHDVSTKEVYQFPDKASCVGAERECKRVLCGGILSKDEMPDGYTETTSVENLDAIRMIYKMYGGTLVEEN